MYKTRLSHPTLLWRLSCIGIGDVKLSTRSLTSLRQLYQLISFAAKRLGPRLPGLGAKYKNKWGLEKNSLSLPTSRVLSKIPLGFFSAKSKSGNENLLKTLWNGSLPWKYDSKKMVSFQLPGSNPKSLWGSSAPNQNEAMRICWRPCGMGPCPENMIQRKQFHSNFQGPIQNLSRVR